jgi:hypothetical protein
MPDEHFLADNDMDADITKRAEAEGKKKGEYMHDTIKRDLRGKSKHGNDPLSKVLVAIEKAKVELKDIKQEQKDAVNTLLKIKEIQEMTEKMPAFIDMRQKHAQIYHDLCNSALTQNQIARLYDELDRIKDSFDQEVVFKWARIIDFFNNKPVTNIYQYELQFLSEKTWEMLRRYREFSGNCDCENNMADSAIQEWIMLDWYGQANKRSGFCDDKKRTFEQAFPELCVETFSDFRGRTFKELFPELYLKIGTMVKTKSMEKPTDSQKTETEAKAVQETVDGTVAASSDPISQRPDTLPLPETEAEKMADKLGLDNQGK